MKRRARVLKSPTTDKYYVQLYTKTGHRSGEPIEITSEFLGTLVGVIRAAPGGIYAIQEAVTVNGKTSKKRITIGIVSEEVVNEEPAKFVPSHE